MKTWRIIIFLFLLEQFTLAGDNQAKIVWGASTNDLRLGIRFQTKFSSGLELHKQTVLYLGTTNGTRRIEVFRPSEFDAFFLTIRDADGKEVAKTRFGQKYGNVPPVTAQFDDRPISGSKRWRLLVAVADQEDQVTFFNIADHFEQLKSGEYELSVSLRVYQRDGAGSLKLLMLPTSSAKFRVP